MLSVFLLSDIHIEHDQTIQVSEMPDADVLILAGDIGYLCEQKTQSFFKHISQKFPHILFVPGNHEYWSEMNDEQMEQVCADYGIIMLQNDVEEIEGVKFAGTTLWSGLHGITSKSVAKQNDFKFHPGLSTDKWRKMHHTAITFLNSVKADVVITHHAPLLKAIPPIFRGDCANGFYATNIAPLRHVPKFWCFGHTHHPFQETIDSTTFLSNPYIDVEYVPHENALSDTKLFIL